MSTNEQKMPPRARTRRAGEPPRAGSLTLTPLQRRILGAVVRARSLTRADIARELRLSRSNLSPVILDLIDDGLLVSVGQDTSRGGRRGDLLGVAGPEAGVVAGLEIDVNRIRVHVTGLGLDVATARHELVDTARAPLRTLELAATLIAESLDPTYGPLVGVGLSLPAAIDSQRGVPTVA